MSAATVAKLDGTLGAVAKEIARLHGDILSAARMSLEKAIRIGELLTRVKASRKGKWLLWLKEHAPFDQKTAWRYMHCYDNRGKLGNVPNLTAAYEILALPDPQKPKRERRSKAVEQLVSKGIAKDARAAREMLRKREEEAEEPKPEPKPRLEPDSGSGLPAPRGWTPGMLEGNDLTDEELGVVKRVREYLAGTSKGRCEVFLRYIRENLECGA
jgi:hypothetical protein